MGGDARIRWISNNGLEMVRKPVKQGESAMVEASKRERMLPSHGTSERATAVEACGHGKIVEGIATVLLSQEVQGLYRRSRREHWNITEVRRSLF
jgi:hypothetical protein